MLPFHGWLVAERLEISTNTTMVTLGLEEELYMTVKPVTDEVTVIVTIYWLALVASIHDQLVLVN